MSRVVTVHGSFEAPPGWIVLEGEGAAEGPLVEDSVRRSIVVHGDRPLEGGGPRDYMAMQQRLLPEVIPGYGPLELRTLSDETWGPWLLRHRIDAPGEPALLQWQVYFFEEDRVGIMTATAPAEDPGDLQSQVFRAAGSFAFAERPSAEDQQLAHHDHHGDEAHHHRDQ